MFMRGTIELAVPQLFEQACDLDHTSARTAITSANCVVIELSSSGKRDATRRVLACPARIPLPWRLLRVREPDRVARQDEEVDRADDDVVRGPRGRDRGGGQSDRRGRGGGEERGDRYHHGLPQAPTAPAAATRSAAARRDRRTEPPAQGVPDGGRPHRHPEGHPARGPGGEALRPEGL